MILPCRAHSIDLVILKVVSEVGHLLHYWIHLVFKYLAIKETKLVYLLYINSKGLINGFDIYPIICLASQILMIFIQQVQSSYSLQVRASYCLFHLIACIQLLI